ncbi:MAG: calcium-translocating P-type ATPase, PMCA-type [Clostridia bacterium]|nr:calcium-translocating P-type ATPase, PMCA-type [Clostridia bacterium]
MQNYKNNGTQKYGLSEKDVELSRAEHGNNILSASKPKGFWRHFLENLGDPVIKILLCALVVNLLFVFRGGDIAETLGIAISVFLAAFISALSERGGEQAFEKLSAEFDNMSYRVRRDGKIKKISINDVVVGDVILIGAGERIPADARIFRGEMSVDQSSITGESKEITKIPSSEREISPSAKNILLRGCPVISGEGELEVVAVGDKSLLGQISREIQIETRESPLKLRLAKLARQISRLGYLAAILVALAFLFNTFVIDSGFRGELILLKLSDIHFTLEKLLHAFMLGLTVIVVAVPEGLPMMIAVVLSSNIKKMVRDKVLVRKPVGIEAAGSMNILFTDKTGTLTEGKMSVGRLVCADGSELELSTAHRKASAIFDAYTISCVLNTMSSISDTGAVTGGNSTDRALLSSVAHRAPEVIRAIKVSQKIPFDSAYKYSAAQLSDKDRSVIVKGAPERLLPFVSRCLTPSGSVDDFRRYYAAFSQKIAAMCAAGERVLLVATSRDMPHRNKFGELTLVCAVSLSDPLRKEARASVSELQGAGIQVVMITGDSKATASGIAKKCGILCSERSVVLDGDELARLDDTSLKKLLPRLAVISRALPTDKSRLVRIAQELELVVGMTGDGVNDAPALKRADIGFAMGSGTEVAKDAGDIIILDNNLASIVRSVLYGRNIFKSIRKFITLQITMNFCAVGVSMIGPFIGIDAPVTVVQMLWINIIMDTLGGLAFAGEAPSKYCMREKPKRRDEPIMNRYMINQIVLLGSFTVALCLAFLLSPSITARFRTAPDRIYHLSAFFALFIFTSVFNCFNARSDRLNLLSGLSKNKIFIAIMSAICIIQIIFVYLGGSVLRTAPPLTSELLFTLGLSLLVFPAEMIRKLIWRICGRKDGF